MQPLLLKPEQVGELLGVRKRKAYDLIETVPDLKAAVVFIPGLRGLRLRYDLVVKAVERMAPADANAEGRKS